MTVLHMYLWNDNLDYKSAAQAPKEIRRQLFRLSALLELADDEFALIRKRTSEITAQYKKDVISERLKGNINVQPWNKGGIKETVPFSSALVPLIRF